MLKLLMIGPYGTISKYLRSALLYITLGMVQTRPDERIPLHHYASPLILKAYWKTCDRKIHIFSSQKDYIVYMFWSSNLNL